MAEPTCHRHRSERRSRSRREGCDKHQAIECERERARFKVGETGCRNRARRSMATDRLLRAQAPPAARDGSTISYRGRLVAGRRYDEGRPDRRRKRAMLSDEVTEMLPRRNSSEDLETVQRPAAPNRVVDSERRIAREGLDETARGWPELDYPCASTRPTIRSDVPSREGTVPAHARRESPSPAHRRASWR